MSEAITAGQIAFVADLAESAGAGLRRRFRTPRETLELDYKGPRDLVTVADRESEAIIVAGLRRGFPDCAILSEEASPQLAIEWDGNESFWIVDPLDGTTNFAHGFPFFSVSIAWWHAGRVRAGVIHAPMQHETFWAIEGQGSHARWRGCEHPERLVATTENRLDHALLATGFSYRRREVEEGALASFADLLANAREIRRGGSACLDLAYTAAGIFGGFWEYHLQPHDTAAGALLVTEAGGRVTDVAGGADYVFGGSIVAAGPSLHPQILGRLRTGPRHPGRSRP
ncbi:MAG: inositol monophosphatase [Planctomycetota bacterium]